jgi:hypothetical protein
VYVSIENEGYGIDEDTGSWGIGGKDANAADLEDNAKICWKDGVVGRMDERNTRVLLSQSQRYISLRTFNIRRYLASKTRERNDGCILAGRSVTDDNMILDEIHINMVAGMYRL